MKKTGFSEEQMVGIPRTAEAAPVAEVAKTHGISEATIYGWRMRYRQRDSTDVKRLGHLEQGNAKLKRLVADCHNRALKEPFARSAWSEESRRVIGGIQ